ncbi:MAG: hypothetical protein ACFB4I_08475 [Cyanophyceae cyanobacterium]
MSASKQYGIGIFSHYLETEVALHKLQEMGISKEQISFVAQIDEMNHDVTAIYFDPDDNDSEVRAAKNRIVQGGLFESLVEVLDNVKSLKMPILGETSSVVAGGTLAHALRKHADETEFCVVNALLELGISQEQAQHFSDRVHHGDCLIVLNGTTTEVEQVGKELAEHGIKEWSVLDQPRLAAQ